MVFLFYQLIPTASVYFVSTTLAWQHGTIIVFEQATTEYSLLFFLNQSRIYSLGYLTVMLEEVVYLITYVIVGWALLPTGYFNMLFKPEETHDS